MRLIAIPVVTLACLSSCAARTELDDSVFSNRIRAYMDVRQAAVDASGRLEETDDPRKLYADRATLASAIITRRSSAREGDLLGGSVESQIRTALTRRFTGRNGEALVALAWEAQPDGYRARVNQEYPGDEPRARMPAAVLGVLPPLPQQLSFRFVGRDLVLLDRSAGVVLDVLRDVLAPV